MIFLGRRRCRNPTYPSDGSDGSFQLKKKNFIFLSPNNYVGSLTYRRRRRRRKSAETFLKFIIWSWWAARWVAALILSYKTLKGFVACAHHFLVSNQAFKLHKSILHNQRSIRWISSAEIDPFRDCSTHKTFSAADGSIILQHFLQSCKIRKFIDGPENLNILFLTRTAGQSYKTTFVKNLVNSKLMTRNMSQNFVIKWNWH